MFKNYMKTAWRRLIKNKIFSFINIFGLTTGLTACLMIFLFVMNECSVDSFHTNGRNIYRVVRGYDPAKPPSPFISSPYARALLNDFPGEIRQAVRVMPNDASLIVYNNRSFHEKQVIWADSNFFTVFSFPLLKGNPATCLNNPNSIVLTETTAKKYFGNEDPMGKILEIDKTFKVMVTGIAKDLSAVLINRTAAASLGYTPEAAIGRWIRNAMLDSARRRIVGVVEDFNFTPLKQNIEPLVIAPNPGRRAALIKLHSYDLARSINAVKEAYARAAPAYPCEYSFLDQNFDRLYSKDLRQQNILGIFSGLAILIACLGLFGLTSFTTARRTREIGIRKVLGSSVRNVVLLLSKELLWPVLLATLIAIPFAYGIMHSWLQNFAYRTAVQWWLFVLSAAITVVIALCTVTVIAAKAAMADPVKSLRTE